MLALAPKVTSRPAVALEALSLAMQPTYPEPGGSFAFRISTQILYLLPQGSQVENIQESSKTQ